MEYTAALEGLRALPERSRVCIVTDSTLMIDSMTKWIAGWKRRGWKTAGGDPVKNQDLVMALEAEIGRHASVRWHWVRGHETGAEHAHKALNDRADRLAVAAPQAAWREPYEPAAPRRPCDRGLSPPDRVATRDKPLHSVRACSFRGGSSCAAVVGRL